MKVKRVGVDLAKTVFQVHGVDGNEQPVWRRRLSRARWVEAVTAKLAAGGEIGMEAGAGAHHWARAFQSRGYRVKLIAPAVRQTLREEQQARCGRRRSDLRGDEPPEHAFCIGQERGTTGYSGGAPGAC